MSCPKTLCNNPSQCLNTGHSIHIQAYEHILLGHYALCWFSHGLTILGDDYIHHWRSWCCRNLTYTLVCTSLDLWWELSHSSQISGRAEGKGQRQDNWNGRAETWKWNRYIFQLRGKIPLPINEILSILQFKGGVISIHVSLQCNTCLSCSHYIIAIEASNHKKNTQHHPLSFWLVHILCGGLIFCQTGDLD